MEAIISGLQYEKYPSKPTPAPRCVFQNFIGYQINNERPKYIKMRRILYLLLPRGIQ